MLGLARVFHWGPLTAICIIKWISLGMILTMALTLSVSVCYRVVREVMGSILGPNRVIDQDIKRCIHCCYVRCTTLIV